MIEKILIVSTGNITEEDCKKLNLEESFSFGDFEYGFFIFCPAANLIKEKYSKAFCNIVKLACKLQCIGIVFDRDADTLPGFPVFDW